MMWLIFDESLSMILLISTQKHMLCVLIEISWMRHMFLLRIKCFPYFFTGNVPDLWFRCGVTCTKVALKILINS